VTISIRVDLGVRAGAPEEKPISPDRVGMGQRIEGDQSMSMMPIRPPRTDARRRVQRSRWRMAASTATAVVLAATGAATAGGPAQAQADCLTVRTQASAACDGPSGRDLAPTVVLTSPTDGSALPSVCAVRLTAEVSAGTGTVDRVEFHVNGHLVGGDDSAPYGIDVPPGHPAFGGGGPAPHTAFARVVTTSPAATADSPAVSFRWAPLPPALLTVACPSRVQVPEGGSATVTFVTICWATPGLNLTVAGDSRVSVTPASSPPGTREHHVTVTAAPGSAGAVARITATAQASPYGCLPASTLVTVGPST